MEKGTIEDWRYEHKIPSEPDYCAKVIHVLLDQLEKFSWSNKDTFGIHMAMEEAIMNAIRHGNQCAPNKDVQLEIEISKDRFYAKITDQGCGFDPEEIPDPTEEENLEKTCGRGVMLIRSFVDEVTYSKKGNSLELTKYRSEK